MDQEVKLYECYSCKRRDYMNNLFPMNYIVKEVNCDLAGISLVTTNIRAKDNSFLCRECKEQIVDIFKNLKRIKQCAGPDPTSRIINNIHGFLSNYERHDGFLTMTRNSCIAVVPATEKACMENEGWQDREGTRDICIEDDENKVEPAEFITNEIQPSEQIAEPNTFQKSSLTIQKVVGFGQDNDPLLVELPENRDEDLSGSRIVNEQNNLIVSSVRNKKEWTERMVKQSNTKTGWICIICGEKNSRLKKKPFSYRGIYMHILHSHHPKKDKRKKFKCANKRVLNYVDMIKSEIEDQAHGSKDAPEDEQFSVITSTERGSEQMNYEPDTTLNETTKRWSCEECSKAYTAKSSLDRHLSDKHFLTRHSAGELIH